MAGNPDIPRWAESLGNKSADWTADEASDALYAVAETMETVIVPHRGVSFTAEIGQEEPPMVGDRFDIAHEGDLVAHYDDLPEPERVRKAANEVLETLHWMMVGLDADPEEIDEHEASLLNGINQLDIATELLCRAVQGNLNGKLASVAQSIVDTIRNKVQQAVGKLWQHLKRMGTIDSWQVSGSIGTSVPGFTGNVSVGLTFK